MKLSRAAAHFTPTVDNRPNPLRLQFALAALLSLLMTVAPAAAEPAADFDVRAPRENALPSAPAPLTPGQVSALEDLRRAAQAELTVSWSQLTGAPSRLTGRGQPLSPPSTESPSEIATSFLDQYRQLLKLSARDIEDLRETRDFQTTHNGVTHLSLQQQANSIDVFGGDLRFNIDTAGQVLNLSGEPIPNVHDSANGILPGTNPGDALDAAADAAGIETVVATSSPSLIYFPLAAGNVRLAWLVTFEDAANGNLYESIVDATNDDVLWRKSLTFDSHIRVHGTVFKNDSPIPNTPRGSSTGVLARKDVPFKGKLAFPHGDVHFDWFAGGASEITLGNNVLAYSDAANDDTFDAGDETIAGTDLNGNDFFDFPLDLTQQPSTYTDAAITNLFFWSNRSHDRFYEIGFDEVAGNFQDDNFGLGGSDDDPVFAEAQDGEDFCNANMSVPADGNSPRMQMYLCDQTSPMRDAALDAAVITHEYSHGVHVRLVPTFGNQRENEGWADYFALSFLAKRGEPYDGAYGISGYLFGDDDGSGIRSAPYSTDPAIYPRTFADINDATTCAVATCSSDDTETCTESADCSTPGDTCDTTSCAFHEDCEPTSTAISQGPCVTQVHRTGELWANALWIARFNLVEKMGFKAGSRRMNRLVVDGMKMSPADPTFLDVRDAILTADEAGFAGADVCILWNAFARMGMGFSAETSGIDDINPVEEFDVPDECSPNLQTNSDTDFGTVCQGDSSTTPLEIFNTGTGELIVTSVERISGSTDISVDPQPDTPVFIEPGSHVDFTIRCTPTSPGVKTATIRIESNDPDTPQRDIVYTCIGGNADLQVAIANGGEFNDICKGDHEDLSVTLFNQGTCDLTITSIALLPNAGPFVLPSDLEVSEEEPLVLGSGAEFSFPLRFAPEVCFDEPITRTLVINSDDLGETTVNVEISGTSPCPNLVIDPAPGTGIYAFEPTVVDTTGTLGCYSERTAVLRNTGTCPLTINSISAAGTTNSPDFAVTAPSRGFPILLPTGEETLEVSIRFTPKSDANPLAPSELLGTLEVASDDPDFALDPASGRAGLCGESVAQSGVRLLVTDVSSGTPQPVDVVDTITLTSNGISTPSPISIHFVDQAAASATVCGKTIRFHVDQESLPATATPGTSSTSSYEVKAKEGNLSADLGFTLGQCELREFQMQLLDSTSPTCILKPKGASCVSPGECCSGSCKGSVGSKTCK